VPEQGFRCERESNRAPLSKSFRFMSSRAVRFFIPAPKRDTPTQTSFSDGPDQTSTLVDQFRSSDLSSLLTDDVHPFRPISNHITLAYTNRLGFYVANLSDPRFDPLTPPRDILDGLQPSIYLELFDREFLVSSAGRSPHHRFCYDLNAAFILESLETGVLLPMFADFISKIGGACQYECGFLVCECLDRRYRREIKYRIRLDISPPIISDAIRSQSSEDPLQGPLLNEQTVLSICRPIICTDPSPDVARAQTVLDFRTKMWQPRERSFRPEAPVLGRPAKTGPRNAVALDQFARVKLEIPEDIQDCCQALVKKRGIT
jgi:hypothetical protein